MAEREKACRCIREIRSFVGDVDRAIIESFLYRFPEAASSLRAAGEAVDLVEKCLEADLAVVRDALGEAEKALKAHAPGVVGDHLETANWRLLAKVRDACGV